MFIGSLSISDMSFYHEGTKIEFKPDTQGARSFSFGWQKLYDTGVDVVFSLERKSYVGSLYFETTPATSIASVVMLLDGKIVARSSGKPVSGCFTLPVAAHGKDVILRLKTDVKSIGISGLEVLGSYEDGTPALWPTPANVRFGEGSVKISDISAKSTDDKDEAFAVMHLDSIISERLLDCKAENGVKAVFEKCPDMESERFTVSVKPEGILVRASSRIALLWGAETVASLVCDGGVLISEIDDKPYRAMRGFHCGLPSYANFAFFERLIKYVLLPMRYNHIIIEFCGGMRFDKRPLISEKWLEAIENSERGLQPPMPHAKMGAEGTLLEKWQVRELCDSIRKYGLEIVPEVQSFGHVQYITYAYPEIAEVAEDKLIVTDTRLADANPDHFYNHCYCPSNPLSYEIIYDIIDEIVEVVKPERFVHMGHDEIYDIGVCPKCRDKDHAELYAKHVTAMHDYLEKKGYRMMIWSDMLQPTEKRYKTSPAREMLPKDILMLDFIWYFHFDLDMEDHILPYGYEIMAGNLYSSHYPRYSSRMAKDGMVGGQVSTWVSNNEEAFADNGKMWDSVYTAEMLWSDKYDERLRECYNYVIKKFQPYERTLVRGEKLRKKVSFESVSFKLGCKDSVPSAILENRSGAKLIGDGVIAENLKADAVVFEHAALHGAPRIPWNPLYRLGEYVIEYSDGERLSVPVTYAGNIVVWNRRFADPLPQQYYRHQGYIGTWYSDPTLETKTACGGDVLLMSLTWENPSPEKNIASISYKSEKDDYCGLILASVNKVIYE